MYPYLVINVHEFRVVKNGRHVGYVSADNYTVALAIASDRFGESELMVFYIPPGYTPYVF